MNGFPFDAAAKNFSADLKDDSFVFGRHCLGAFKSNILDFGGVMFIVICVAWWCNGSTGVFGTLSRGSNPCRAATFPTSTVFFNSEIIVEVEVDQTD